MNLVNDAGNNLFEKLYGTLSSQTRRVTGRIVPCLRRLLRFCALPYLYFYMIDWHICTISRFRVISDLMYIFFRLKYFPDNYFMCKLWQQDREDWPFYYGSIYDPYQREMFQRTIYEKSNIVLFENKHVCYQLCSAGGFPLPAQFGMLFPFDDYRERIKTILGQKNGRIILKAYDGKGGKGIVVCYRDKDRLLVKRNEKVCDLSSFNLNHPVVVQEQVKQHPFLNEFSTSVNTIRIVTLLTRDNDVLIIGAFIRFGIEGSDVDNLSSGGIAAGVNVSTGEIHRKAIAFDGKEYTCHPTTGKPLQGCRVPCWEQASKLVKDVQKHFFYHRSIGIDVCITETGPLIIEINAEPDMVALEMTYGPIFQRREVWEEFARYDLLINEKSRHLYR